MNLEIVAVELLKPSLQSLCTGAMTSTGVRHEHHHSLLPLRGCLPLACEVVSAHCAQCTAQRQSWYQGSMSMIWSTEVSGKGVLPLPKEKGQRIAACAGLLPPTCSSQQVARETSGVRLSALDHIANVLTTTTQGY